jgi:hypothetical protein
MVRLSLAQFADASARMCQHSGVKKTRLMMKIRAKGKDGGKVVLKCTDDRTTLTTSTDDARDLKIVEQLICDFVTRCTADAPAEIVGATAANAASSGGGSTKTKKKGKK